MSYTPTTWATGDTITAQKMNKLENGVANAGGFGGAVGCVVTTANFPTGVAANVGWIEIFKKTGDTYQYISIFASGTDAIIVPSNCTVYASVPVVSLEGYHVFLSLGSGVTMVSSSGGIASEPASVYGGLRYEITGDFEISVSGWD